MTLRWYGSVESLDPLCLNLFCPSCCKHQLILTLFIFHQILRKLQLKKLYQFPKVSRWAQRTLQTTQCVPVWDSCPSKFPSQCGHIIPRRVGDGWYGEFPCREGLSIWFCKEERWDFDGYCKEWINMHCFSWEDLVFISNTGGNVLVY